MIYDIKHVTTYEYGSTVTYSNCALRLLPREEAGQIVYASHLDVTPAPDRTDERVCFFGNRVTSMTIGTAHRTLSVAPRPSVELLREPPPAGGATATRRRTSSTPAASCRTTRRRPPTPARVSRPVARCWKRPRS